MRSTLSKLCSMLCVLAMLLSIVPMPAAWAADEPLSYTAHFNDGIPAGTIYTIKGSLKSGIDVTLSGVGPETFTQGLKVESGGKTEISFTAPGEGTLTLYCTGSDGNTLSVTATPTEGAATTQSITLTAGKTDLKTNANTAYKIVKGSGSPVVLYIDWAPDDPKMVLSNAIAAAKATATEWTDKVSVDGSDVPVTEKWVTAAAMKALTDATAKAQGVLDQAGVTDEALAAAKTELEKAVADFKAAQKDGLKPGALVYKLTETQKQFNIMGDRDLLPPGQPVFLSPYFTAVVDADGSNEGLHYRLQAKTPCALEVGRAANKNGVEFTTQSAATVKITFRSTSAENVSVLGLMKNGGLVNYTSVSSASGDYATAAIAQAGNGKTGGNSDVVVVYENLPAGTYRVCSPEVIVAEGTAGNADPSTRGARIMDIEVTEAERAPEAPLASTTDPAEITGVDVVLPKGFEDDTFILWLPDNTNDSHSVTTVLTGKDGKIVADRQVTVQWSVTDNTVATVEPVKATHDVNGKSPGTITPQAVGETTITVTVVDAEGKPVVGADGNPIQTSYTVVVKQRVTSVTVTGPNGGTTGEDLQREVRGVNITVQMEETVKSTPETATPTDPSVTWSIKRQDGKAIVDDAVTIDPATGVVTATPAAEKGVYVVTATSNDGGNKSGSANLTLVKAEITAVKFVERDAEGKPTETPIGDTAAITMLEELTLTADTDWASGTYNVNPWSGADALTWKAEPEGIVELEGTDSALVYNVKPLKAGVVTITATSVRDNTKKATLTLTVNKATPSLVIGTRNDEVRAEGNTVNLHIDSIPAGLTPINVTIASKSGPTGTATVQAMDTPTEAWNYVATLPANASTTERAVYTVTASFAGDANWEAATETHDLQVLKQGEANIRFNKVNGGVTTVEKTSGDTGDKGLSLNVEAVYVKENIEYTDKLEYQWYKLTATDEALSEDNKIAGATAATYTKADAVKSTDVGFYRCEVSYTDDSLGTASAVSPIITVKVAKAASTTAVNADIDAGTTPWPKLSGVKEGWQYSLDQKVSWITVGEVQEPDANGLGWIALENEDPADRDGRLKAVNDLYVRDPGDEDTLPSEPQLIDLLRATTPGLVARDQQIVINNYGNYSTDGSTQVERVERAPNPLDALYQISVDGGKTWNDLSIEKNMVIETNAQNRETAVIKTLPKGTVLPVDYVLADGTKLVATQTLADDATVLTNSVVYQVRIKSGGHVLGSYEAKAASPLADWSALTAALADAGEKAGVENVQVSADGTGKDVRPKEDVDGTQYWVAKTDRDTFDTALTTAGGVRTSYPWYTTSQVGEAAAVMSAATQTYVSAWKSEWPHIHAWDTQWTSDDNGHWHKCIAPASGSFGACDITDYSATTETGAAYAAHDWDETITKQPTCEDKGEKSKTCKVCGKTVTEEMEPIGHAWGKWTMSADHNGFVSRVCGNNAAHTQSMDLEVTLSPSSYTYGGDAKTPTPTVTVGEGDEAEVLELNTDYTVTYADHTNAGSAKAVITGKGDYAGSMNATFTIAPKALTATAATVEGRDYDGTSAVTVTAVTLSGVVGDDDVKVDVTGLTATLLDGEGKVASGAGSYSKVRLQGLKLTGADKGNYTLAQANLDLDLTAEVEIGKATPPVAKNDHINIANHLELTYTYGLSNLRPAINAPGSTGKDWGTVSYQIDSVAFDEAGYYDATTAAASINQNNELILPIQLNDTTTEGKVGTVTVIISSSNYDDLTAELEVWASNKTHVTFEGIPVDKVLEGTLYAPDKVYDGAPYHKYTKDDVTVKNGNVYVTDADVEISYAATGTTAYPTPDEPPINAGTYRIIVRVSDADTKYIGRQAYYFTIHQAEGEASVNMADYTCGQGGAVTPQPTSATNGTTGVRYEYKVKGAPDSTYSANKPTKAAQSTLNAPVEATVYTVRATFPESQDKNYKAVTATADFTVSHVHEETWTRGENSHYRLCSCGDQGHEEAHDIQLQGKKDPTCTQPGNTGTERCTVCGLVKTAGQTIPVIDHTYNGYEKDENGHWQKCTVCQTETAKATHTWDAGVVNTEATLEAPGLKTFTCTVCGQTKTQVIPQLTPGVDKSKLEEAIREAEKAKAEIENTQPAPETSQDGTDVDKDKTWLPEGAKDKLDEELQKALDVFNDPNATQEQVDKATQDLTAAIVTPKPGTKELTYTVRFDTQVVGVNVADQAVVRGGKAVKPTNPVRNGYTFGGWYKDSACTEAWDFAADAVNGDVTLYAKWTRNSTSGGGGRRPSPAPSEEHRKEYVDVPGHWGEKDIYDVSDRGIFEGTDETHFTPDGPMNRAMMATVIYRMDGSHKMEGGVTFHDVDMTSWYADALIWGADKVVVKGYSAEAFGPNDPITREQLATMIYRYAGLKGLVKGEAPAELTYTDADQVSDWAYEAVAWMTANGLLIGRQNHDVDPLANATRAEVATVLARFVRFCEK